MTFTPGSPLNDDEDNLSEEGLDKIIEERDKRLKQLYDEIVYRDSEFKKIQEDRTQEEFDKANRPIQRIYQLGKAVAPEQVRALFDLFEGKFNPKLLPLDKTKGLLKEQKDLPKPPEIKGFIPAESTDVPLDVVENFPAIQTIYKRSGLNKEQKGLLRSIFDRITGKTQEEYIMDPTSANFGALIEDVEEAEGYYGTPPRAFFNKRKVDKRGRMYDLATGKFNVNELARRYPVKRIKVLDVRYRR